MNMSGSEPAIALAASAYRINHYQTTFTRLWKITHHSWQRTRVAGERVGFTVFSSRAAAGADATGQRADLKSGRLFRQLHPKLEGIPFLCG